MGAFLKWYTSTLKNHQITTNMATTGSMFLIGDVMSQQLVEGKKKEHQVGRTIRSVATGTLYIAPYITFLYNFVDKLFGPSQTPLTALKKVGVLSLFSPTTSAGYLLLNNLLQGKPWSYTLHQYRYDLPTIVLTGYTIWLPTHFCLLTLIPLRHRVLLSNCVGVVWTTYLTYAAHRQSSVSEGDVRGGGDKFGE